jgi:hypothetical protein
LIPAIQPEKLVPQPHSPVRHVAVVIAVAVALAATLTVIPAVASDGDSRPAAQAVISRGAGVHAVVRTATRPQPALDGPGRAAPSSVVTLADCAPSPCPDGTGRRPRLGLDDVGDAWRALLIGAPPVLL